MARAKQGLERAAVQIRGKRDPHKSSSKYAAGWLKVPDQPGEDMIRLGGYVWSEMFVGAETRRIYKHVKKTGEWFRFAFIITDDAKVDVT
jgi:hypothetical protein